MGSKTAHFHHFGLVYDDISLSSEQKGKTNGKLEMHEKRFLTTRVLTVAQNSMNSGPQKTM